MVASERGRSEPAVARERRACRASGSAAMRGNGDDVAGVAKQVNGASGDAAVASVVNRDSGNGAMASVVSEANGMYVEVRRNN